MTTKDVGAATAEPSAMNWTPPAKFVQAAYHAASVLSLLGVVPMMYGCVALWRQCFGEAYQLAGLGLTMLPYFAMMAIHEGGHVIGGWLKRMIVVTGQVGPFNFLTLHRGIKWRWRWSRRNLHAYIAVLPNGAEPIVPQQFWVTLGGPLANIVVGFVFGVIGWLLWPGNYAEFVLGFAALNLFTGLANLLPFHGVADSDGLMLLRWLRIKDDDIGLIPYRLNALAASGTTADLLPSAQVAKLQDLPEPMPLLHLWFVLKAHQNRLEWEQAAALGQSVELRVSALTPALTLRMEDLISMIRSEIEFSRLMAGLPLEGPVDRYLTTELDWLSPGLRERYAAARLAGSSSKAEVQALLARSESALAESRDRAQVVSEAKIRAAVLERCR